MKPTVILMTLLAALPAHARTVRVAVCQILSIEYALEDARAAIKWPPPSPAPTAPASPRWRANTGS